MTHAKMASGCSAPPRRDTKRQIRSSFFVGKSNKDALHAAPNTGEASGGHSEADDTVPLEDAGGLSSEWNTVSTPKDILLGNKHPPP